MDFSKFYFINKNDVRNKHNKYEYINHEAEVFSSDTVCNCSYVYKCKCSKDNPVNRLSDEGIGRVQDELNPTQQEDYDAVYGLDKLPLLFNDPDIIDSNFDSNDDIEEASK